MRRPWGLRRPQVFAKLDGEAARPDLEYLVRANAKAAEFRVGLEVHARTGGEPAALVELGVVGQGCLGNYAGDPAVGNYRGRVEQPPVRTWPGCTQYGRDARVRLGDSGKCRAGVGEQLRRQQQVFATVAGQTEFGKHGERGAGVFEAGEMAEDLLGIGQRLGKVYLRCDGRGSQVAEIGVVHGWWRHAQF